MAALTAANLQTLAGKLGYLRKQFADAKTAITTALASFETTARGINDDQRICDALVVAAQKATVTVPKVFAEAAQTLAGAFQNTTTAPVLPSDGVTQSTSFADFAEDALGEAGFTEGLLNNHFVEWLREHLGTGAVPAAIAAGPDGTAFASALTVTGETTFSGGVVVAAPIDTDYYGGCLLCATVTTQVEGKDNGNTVLTLAGVDYNGSVTSGTITIPDASIVGTVVNYVPSTAKVYPVRLTSITLANGASGAVTITSKTTQTLDV